MGEWVTKTPVETPFKTDKYCVGEDKHSVVCICMADSCK